MPVTWSGPLLPYRRPERGSWRLDPMPVLSPPARPPAPRPKRRRSPGDPACDRCPWSRHGACADHLGYRAEVDPLRTLA